MTNEEIRRYLTAHSETKYKDFSSSLIPECGNMLGVRIPVLRKLAKELSKGDWKSYLLDAENGSYEEVMLQGLTIGYVKTTWEEILPFVRTFIPKITDWSINDCFCSTMKIVGQNRNKAWDFLMEYADSTQEFEQRMVAVMLMDHFLVEEYIDKVLDVWERLRHEGYYRKMGVAWGIATAYAEFPEKTHAFLLNNHLDDETYNKAIQKMLESFRISPEQKETLRKMKRKV